MARSGSLREEAGGRKPLKLPLPRRRKLPMAGLPADDALEERPPPAGDLAQELVRVERAAQGQACLVWTRRPWNTGGVKTQRVTHVATSPQREV